MSRKVRTPLVGAGVHTVKAAPQGSFALSYDTPADADMVMTSTPAVRMVTIRRGLQDVGLQVVRPFTIKIKQAGQDNYVASFSEAGAHASGDSIQESFNNLKDTIAHLFWRLSTLDQQKMTVRARSQRDAMVRHFARA